MSEFPEWSVPGRVDDFFLSGGSVLHWNCYGVWVEYVEAFHSSLEVFQHDLIAQELISFKFADFLENEGPIVYFGVFEDFVEFLYSRSHLDKSVDGFFDYFFFLSVVDDIGVEFECYYFFYVFGAYGVFVIVVDEAIVVVVGDDELIDCLIEIQVDIFVVFHFFGIEEDFV